MGERSRDAAGRSGGLTRDALRLWMAGALLALLEVGWTLARGDSLFLSVRERLLYALASVGALSACVLVLGGSMRLASASTLGRRVAGVASGAVVAWLLFQLTSGRRVHAQGFRLPLVVLLALGAAWVSARGLALLARRPSQGERSFGIPLLALVLAAALLLSDALLFHRTYPAFHAGTFLGALACASVAGWTLPERAVGRAERPLGLFALALVLLAPLLLARLAAHPTAGFAVREHAPWSPRLLSLYDGRRVPITSPRRLAAPSAAPGTGVDLRDRDVLLVTIDALRADLLAAYGGSGTTPEIDRLARESAVFVRAYTPAPHTSYALASLLTGKFVKPLIELGQDLGDPPTIPDRLRRYGYRTAAFYPPAIFYVDGARFAALAGRGFGFEYRKEMFASADQRVAQLSDYLAEADPVRPLFVWVHLFEPHEPYDPPEDLAHDDSERGRYEAEVRAADRAVGRLVARFREARPRATVILTADHGEEFGEHGGRFHGSSLYDEQVRVPLLWSSPGAVVPQRVVAPVELTDVGTTVLSTAGVPRDAHMRGDDLGPLLAGHAAGAPERAFAAIEDRHMVTDGRYKAICRPGAPHCALFDLLRDPRETRNLGGERADIAHALRADLDAFLASIPRAEPLTVSAGVGLPDVLARAKLGLPTPAAELLPLLREPRAAVRAETARVLGQLRVHEAGASLARVRVHDEDATTRGEAAVASLLLGDRGARDSTAALIGAPDVSTELRRRAAFALAGVGGAEGLPVLATLASDESANERERREALMALAHLGAREALAPLTAALSSVRLREAAAEALALLGERAVDLRDEVRAALRAQLAEERYPAARRAEAEALRRLADPETAALVAHYLGMESSVPDGVRLLAELGALSPAGRHGARLADGRVRRGSFRCAEDGCTPEARAAIVLPPGGRREPAGPVRVVVWYRAEPHAELTIDGQRFSLHAPEGQLSFVRPSAAAAAKLTVARSGQVALRALAVVPARPEISPPAPEPWDAGAAAAPASTPR